MTSGQVAPFVSVLVPVYNGVDRIGVAIESLLVQDYPGDRFEIIVVDNGSDDGTRDLIERYPVIRLDEPVRSSYAARNTGLRIARGDIVAFTDGDCRARPDWLSKGVAFLLDHLHVDIIGGRIDFTFSEECTASEQWDSLANLDNQSTIAEKNAAVTANLMTRRSVFDSVGTFRGDLSSGGDFEWTVRAVRKGAVLAYCDEAVIEHPARGFKDLVEKSRRVGTGGIVTWRARGHSWLWVFYVMCYLATPAVWFSVPRLIRRRGSPGMRYKLLRIAGVAYATKLVTLLGVFDGIRRSVRFRAR